MINPCLDANFSKTKISSRLRICGFQAAFLILIVVLMNSDNFSSLNLSVNAQVPTIDLIKDRPSTRDVFSPVDSMRNGNVKVVDPADKQKTKQNRLALEKLAKWFAFRLNVPPYNGEPDENPKAKSRKSQDKPIVQLFNELEKTYFLIPGVSLRSKEQYQYADEFCIAMNKELRFVMANANKTIVRINAARMLELISKMPCPSLADSYLAILKDPKEQLLPIKIFAIRGLANVLSHSDTIQPDRHIILSQEKLAEISTALESIITTAAPPELIVDEDQKRTWQFYRRDAIKALAKLRYSVIRSNAQAIIAKPVLTLVRASVAGESFSPEISLPEQVEALIGVIQMRPDRDTNLDVMAYAVNEGVLSIVKKQRPDRNHPEWLRSIPWKITGIRFTNAVTTWKNNIKFVPKSTNSANAKYLQDSLVTNIFQKWEENGSNTIPSTDPLLNYEKTKVPATPFLIKDVKESALWQPASPPAKK